MTGERDGGPAHRATPLPPLPRIGDVLAVGAAASVQFAGDRGFLFRVTRVDQRETYHGWCWLTGYVLDQRGEAVEKREIFVQRGGLRPVPRAVPQPAPRAVPRPNSRPVPGPGQRARPPGASVG